MAFERERTKIELEKRENSLVTDLRAALKHYKGLIPPQQWRPSDDKLLADPGPAVPGDPNRASEIEYAMGAEPDPGIMGQGGSPGFQGGFPGVTFEPTDGEEEPKPAKASKSN